MRDLRDPQKLGEALLQRKTRPLSKSYDTRRVIGIPDVSKDDSMGKRCVEEYRAELEAGAAAGDKYAQSRLETL